MNHNFLYLGEQYTRESAQTVTSAYFVMVTSYSVRGFFNTKYFNTILKIQFLWQLSNISLENKPLTFCTQNIQQTCFFYKFLKLYLFLFFTYFLIVCLSLKLKIRINKI